MSVGPQPLTCPAAEYREGMVIWCTKAEAPCGHVYYKRCKGWWVLSPSAEQCPKRRETHGQTDAPSAGGLHPV